MSEEKVSLNDLVEPKGVVTVTETVTPSEQKYSAVNIETIAPYKEKEDSAEKTMNAIMGNVDSAIDRFKSDVTERAAALYEADQENAPDEDEEYGEEKIATEDVFLGTDTNITEAIDDDDEDEESVSSDSTEVPAPSYVVETPVQEEKPVIKETVVKTEETKPSANIFAELDKDFDEDEDDDEEPEDPELEEKQKQELEEFKHDIATAIKPIKSTVDLGKFTISTKATSVSKMLAFAPRIEAKTAEWVLYSQKRAITMSALSGPELEKINPNGATSRINKYKEIYSIFYKHIVDANKPSTLEAWVKTVNFYDIDNLYFAVYRACYEGDNYLTYQCPKCNKTHVIPVSTMDMVKYDSDEVKKEVMEILNHDTTSTGDIYQATLKQVSDDIAIAYKMPSVYNVVFETAALSDKITDKYSDILGIVSYIDNIYYIDREHDQLVPVSTNPVATDFSKTVRNKIKAYAQILETLTPDQYLEVLAEMKSINDMNEKIKYIMPEMKCPACDATIPEQEVQPFDMLFTRHQLVAIKSI